MNRQFISIFLSLLFCIVFARHAFAQDISEIAENIGDSVEFLPALVASLAYLSGLVVAVSAILKTIEHVNNPTQVSIKVPVIRFLLGGALFALPIVTEAIKITIDQGSLDSFSANNEILDDIGSLFALGSFLSGGTFNSILLSIANSTRELPSLVSVVAYLLALILTLSALYKTRDHVDDPDRAPLKDAVIRYLAAGALFGLPTIFEAMFATIADEGLGTFGTILSLVNGSKFFTSSETPFGIECVPALFSSNAGVGDVLCNALSASFSLPAFLTALSYVIGLVFGVWAILKIRDHVVNPSQTSLWDGISRLLAGGAFFALPVVYMAIQYSVTPNVLAITTLAGTNSGFYTTIPVSCVGTNSLDEAMACFMGDILGPSHVLLNFFAFTAGIIFVMIGISRLTKTAQEGARGPGGLGTIATFVTGGVLMSATTILRAFSTSFFNSSVTATSAELTYTTGMGDLEQAAAYNVINAVLQFMIVIGMISFVRGIFIMRDVAEGSQQASTMAGLTHIIGGALAVNLGPVLNAVQTTLGVTAFGVTFT